MALLDLAKESVTAACYDLPERGPGDSVARAQLSLNFEVQWLIMSLRFQLRCKVEDVLDKVDLALSFLVKEDKYENYDISRDCQTTCVCNYIRHMVMVSLDKNPIESEPDGARYVAFLI